MQTYRRSLCKHRVRVRTQLKQRQLAKAVSGFQLPHLVVFLSGYIYIYADIRIRPCRSSVCIHISIYICVCIYYMEFRVKQHAMFRVRGDIDLFSLDHGVSTSNLHGKPKAQSPRLGIVRAQGYRASDSGSNDNNTYVAASINRVYLDPQSM